MNRVRISGEITKKYEQIIELSDEDLQKLRNDLSEAQTQGGDQGIDDFLATDYSDNEPTDCQCGFWEVDLIEDNGMSIEII